MQLVRAFAILMASLSLLQGLTPIEKFENYQDALFSNYRSQSKMLSKEIIDYSETLKQVYDKISNSSLEITPKEALNKTLDVVRCRHYNSKEWKAFAGNSYDNSSETNIITEDEERQLSVNSTIYLDEDQETEIEIIHTLAGLDMGLNGYLMLGTLGGDIVEATADNTPIGTGRFNNGDIKADIDAINLFNILSENDYNVEYIPLYYQIVYNEPQFRFEFFKSCLPNNDYNDIINMYNQEKVIILLETKYNVTTEKVQEKLIELVNYLENSKEI